MQRSHGINYAEYSRSLEKRLKVEKNRQENYEKENHLVKELTR